MAVRNLITDSDQTANNVALLGVYNTIHEVTALVTDALAASTRYHVRESGVVATTAIGQVDAVRSFYLQAADYAITGFTAKLRLSCDLMCNATALGTTVTIGMYPITACAGAADAISVTQGTVVGQTVAFASPAASTPAQAVSTEFSLPADNHYVIGFVLAGTPAADTRVSVYTQLQLRWV